MAWGGRDHRNAGIFDRHHGLLEAVYGLGDFSKLFFGNLRHKLRQIGAGGESNAIIGDYQTNSLFPGALDGRMNHLEDVVIYGVHLGVEFQAEDAIIQINN